MNIETWKTSDLVPYETNPRQNDAAVDAVARSIEAFGFRQPIVVDADGIIIVGHTRWKAALKLGLECVPVVVAGDMTSAQAKAYRIADNKLGELANWDSDLLTEELSELTNLEVDLDLLGFSEEDLSQLFGQELADGRTDPDQIPEPPDEPIARAGDRWFLGEHRLLCGNAGNDGDVDRLLDGAPVHLINTDPPYNVHVEPRSQAAIAAGHSSFSIRPRANLDTKRSPQVVKRASKKLRARDRPLKNDYLSDVEFQTRLEQWFGNIARVLLPGRSFYIWGGYSNLGNYPTVFNQCGLYFSQAIVWDKQHPVLSRKDYMGSFELAFYGWKEGAAHQFFGPPNALDLWHVKKVNPNAMVHLTEKPVELAVRAIQNSSRLGEHVLDLFGGSGSTLIAAEQTGRRAFLLELDRSYCDVIIQRWERFTGGKAKREPWPASAINGGDAPACRTTGSDEGQEPDRNRSPHTT